MRKFPLKYPLTYSSSIDNFPIYISTLLLDIKKYHSLSDKTLRRLGSIELTPSSSQKVLKEFREEIVLTRKLLKDDYLEILLKRVEGQSNEIIIAIENQ